MGGYFDSHAHYWDRRFETEVEGGAEELLSTLLGKSVSAIVNVGTSPETSLLAIRQAQAHPGMLAAAGIHPSDCGDILEEEGAIAEIEELFSHPEYPLVAVGEIGLDYHYTPFDKEKQLRFFHKQMDLAQRLSLPVILHDREAHGDTLAVIKAHPEVTGVLHSFSGSLEMAKEVLALGYYISFSGTVSFKNAARVGQVAAGLPWDRVLVETDAPYLAPHPHRGKCNHSGLLVHTCEAIAALWGISTEEVARITAENARRFFRLP